MAEAFYSREQVERWQKNLEAIAREPRTTFTKKQVVEALFDTIERALMTRSYDEVACGLKDWGLDISAGSLKQYVTRYRRSHPSKAAANSRKHSGKSKKKKRAAGAGSKVSSATTAKANQEQSAAQKSERTQPAGFMGMDEEDL